MKICRLDLETYSSVDLTKSSVYRYSESPDFRILLCAYAVDDDPVTVLDLTKSPLPEDVISILRDPEYRKVAWNANFERVCLSKYLDEYLEPEMWACSMAHAATLGLPRSLAEAGKALGLPEDQQKMKEGKALIQYFCKPCRPTKANGGRTRNLPEHDPQKWNTFIEYNRRDVETERWIDEKLDAFPVHPDELRAYWLDQRINDRGVLVDTGLMESAIRMNYEHAAELAAEAQAITGLENVNSVAQLKRWLNIEGSLDKKAIAKMRDSGQLSSASDRVLAIRQELGKASVSKYEAMERNICEDGRMHGLFAFYGASRTGRWAGKYTQLQNLPQNHIPDLELARDIVKSGDKDWLQCAFGNVASTLSELIRTALIAKPGHTFCVADFSAIEARVIAWMAGEKWRQENFKKGGDIYCASASRMFHVPVEKHGINGHLRQKGKIAELALGFGGSVGALKAMGALEMGLAEEELKPLVDAWRNSNPRITAFWWDVDNAVREELNNRFSRRRLAIADGAANLDFTVSPGGKIMFIQLPSGRKLAYWKPLLTYEDTHGEALEVDPDDINGWVRYRGIDGRFQLEKVGRANISYEGTELGKWTRIDTYGPKIVENIVQATARDCLRDAMLQVEKRYPGVVMHIHDEMVVEVPKDQAEEALAYMFEVMSTPVGWAPGLILKGDGYCCDFYRKD